MPKAPPPTRPDLPIAEPIARCPFLPSAPCEVRSLEVTASFRKPKEEGQEEAVPVGITVNITAPSRRWTDPGPIFNPLIRRRLEQYDAVLEVFADHPGPRPLLAKDEPAKPAVTTPPTNDLHHVEYPAHISALATFSGLRCSMHDHGVVRLRAHGSEETPGPGIENRRVNYTQIPLEPPPLAATRIEVLDRPWSEERDEAEADGPLPGGLFVFGLISSMFEAFRPREYELTAESCGVREPDIQVEPQLKALIRVYRKDRWSIGIKIPPFGKHTFEGKALREFRTKTDNISLETKARVGSQAVESALEISAEKSGNSEIKIGSTTRSGKDGESVTATTTSEDDYDTTEYETRRSDRAGTKSKVVTYKGRTLDRSPEVEVDKRLESTVGFDLVIKRNDTSLPILDKLKKLKKSLDDYWEALQKLSELFRKAPQWGFKFSYELSLLSGSMSVDVTPEVGDPFAAGRYFPVRHRVHLALEFKLIDVTIKLSFGAEAMMADTGVVLKVQGSLGVKVAVSTKIALDTLKDPKREIKLVDEHSRQFLVTGRVSLWGHVLAGAELSIDGGLELKKGRLVVDLGKWTYAVKGILMSKATTMSGWIKVPWWFDRKLKDVELQEEKELYKYG